MSIVRFTMSHMRCRYLSLLILALMICSSAACRREAPSTPATSATPIPPINNSAAAAIVAQSSYADVVSRVTPAVVTVRSERRARAPQQFPFLDDPRFRDFFGDRTPRAPQREQPPQQGLGSGVIVSQDGYILTNHHVIDGAEDIKVELTDNRTFTAKLVGSDPPSDLAVLKVDESSLPVLGLGDSDRVRVGDVVLAIGNPLGLEQTVTAGIISAKGRATGLSDGSFEDFLQTDAPINQGNSGGALVSVAGELVGINSQIVSLSGGNIGIGFAIPVNMARNVMDQLIKTGRVRRSQLGIRPQNITSDIAASLGLKEVRGVLVAAVSSKSAAERAGLQRGDVITALNGEPVTDSNSFRNRIASTTPGAEVTLTVNRNGREQQLRATLGELSANAQQPGSAPGEGGGGRPESGLLGMSVEPLTPEIAAQLDLPRGTEGVVVVGVDPSGPAAEAEIRRGDVIEQVNRQSVRSTADLRAALERSGDRPALVLVNRRGNSSFVTLRPRQ